MAMSSSGCPIPTASSSVLTTSSAAAPAACVHRAVSTNMPPPRHGDLSRQLRPVRQLRVRQQRRRGHRGRLEPRGLRAALCDLEAEGLASDRQKPLVRSTPRLGRIVALHYRLSNS
jgi:hypothetical protein